MFYINNNIDTVTRFDTIKFFDFVDDNIDPLTSFMLENIKSLPSNGSYMVLNEEKRPDLLSYKIYEDTQYWWLLLVYNGILDISELKAGTLIQYPAKEHIEILYQNASLLRKQS